MTNIEYWAEMADKHAQWATEVEYQDQASWHRMMQRDYRKRIREVAEQKKQVSWSSEGF